MIYHIQKRDINKAAQLLGRSFIDYPLFKCVLPDYQYRAKKVRHFFNFLIKFGLRNGEVIAPSNRIEGISIWINSSNVKSSLFDILRSGFIALMFNTDFKSIRRFTQFGLKKKEIRSNVVKDPYYLLDVIGVDPRFQKQGLARLMIETKLYEFDKLKMPCYLETSNAANIKYYEKLGFNLIYEYEFMTIKTFCLHRQPFASASRAESV